MDDQNNVNTGESTPRGGSAGPVIGIIVILVIIILGGLYFWGQREGNDEVLNEELDAINLQSDSDEVDTIEADLNATDIENLDSEMNAS